MDHGSFRMVRFVFQLLRYAAWKLFKKILIIIVSSVRYIPELSNYGSLSSKAEGLSMIITIRNEDCNVNSAISLKPANKNSASSVWIFSCRVPWQPIFPIWFRPKPPGECICLRRGCAGGGIRPCQSLWVDSDVLTCKMKNVLYLRREKKHCGKETTKRSLTTTTPTKISLHISHQKKHKIDRPFLWGDVCTLCPIQIWRDDAL